MWKVMCFIVKVKSYSYYNSFVLFKRRFIECLEFKVISKVVGMIFCSGYLYSIVFVLGIKE